MTGHEPAFPQTIDDMGTLTSASQGMSIREYFAAKAMAQLIAHKERLMEGNPDLYEGADTEMCVARAAVLQADALILALNEKQP